MRKGSGGTRIKAPGGISKKDTVMDLLNIDGYNLTINGTISAIYENNEAFKKFLVDASKENFQIIGMEDNGSIVELHRDVDNRKVDYEDLLKIARLRAAERPSIVQLTPSVHYKSETYKRIYGDLIGTEYERKCPDIRITTLKGKRFFEEYESFVRPVNDRKVSNMLTDGLTQSNRVIVDIRDGINVSKVIKGINGRRNQYDIKQVSIYDGKSIKTLYSEAHGFLPPYDSWNKKRGG